MEDNAIPPRSYFYHLDPIGVNTPYSEGLSSYLVRLANEYCVAPKVLVVFEILPLLKQTIEINMLLDSDYNAFLTNVKNLNGMNNTTKICVDILEKLTGYNNLRFLSMLTWEDVISRSGLLRGSLAWCSSCYEEWRMNEHVIYNPLLWSLKAAELCLYHQHPLQERCPSKDCQKAIPVFTSVMRLGYCPFCNHWLGGNTDYKKISKEEFEEAYWSVKALGELIEMAPHLPSTFSKEGLALSISSITNSMQFESIVSLAREINLKSPRSIADWQLGKRTPRLSALLNMWRTLEISPKRFFIGPSQRFIFSSLPSSSEEKFGSLRQIRRIRSQNELRKCLEEVLASDEWPPLSIEQVASNLGYRNKASLYEHCPDLARALTARYRAYRKSHGDQKIKLDKLRQTLESILANNEESPSLQDVASSVGYLSVTPLRRRFPDLAKAITAKHRKYNSNQREPMDFDELRRALERVLVSEEEPFPTLEQVAYRVGYLSVTPLRRHFPDLAKAITAKHHKYNKASCKRKVSSEVLKDALEWVLMSEDLPPLSLREVAWQLGYKSSDAIYKRFPEICREINIKYHSYSSKYRRRMSLTELRQVLETILAREDESPSLQEVARRLGYSGSDVIYKRLPEMCRKISEKHQASKSSRSVEELEKALVDIVTSDEASSLTLQEVAYRLGYKTVAPLDRLFPQLMQALRVKMRDNSILRQAVEELLKSDDTILTQQEIMERLDCTVERLRQCFPEIRNVLMHRFINIQEIRISLEKELLSEELRSLNEVARTLGYSVSTLTHYFPDICHKIVVRLQNHRKLNNELRIQKYKDEISLFMRALQEEHKYPSVYQVQKHLESVYGKIPIFYLELYEIWRDVKKQLGYSE